MKSTNFVSSVSSRTNLTNKAPIDEKGNTGKSFKHENECKEEIHDDTAGVVNRNTDTCAKDVSSIPRPI